MLYIDGFQAYFHFPHKLRYIYDEFWICITNNTLDINQCTQRTIWLKRQHFYCTISLNFLRKEFFGVIFNAWSMSGWHRCNKYRTSNGFLKGRKSLASRLAQGYFTFPGKPILRSPIFNTIGYYFNRGDCSLHGSKTTSRNKIKWNWTSLKHFATNLESDAFSSIVSKKMEIRTSSKVLIAVALHVKFWLSFWSKISDSAVYGTSYYSINIQYGPNYFNKGFEIPNSEKFKTLFIE